MFNLQGNSLYVLSDSSIKGLVLRALGKSLDQSSFVFITYAQLIYRFTVATKFNVDISEEKQLRINSWGVKYYSEFLGRSYESTLKALRAEFKKILDEYGPQYSELVCMLKMPAIDSQTASSIKYINQYLSFRLVA
ncbi:hypothetical protein [Pseudomonas sp. FEN]|uniref:hypothetical protein n=1 Tax=Pseudomonas sp. FEN TaxID=2767468 RepID=UPI00174DCE0C|nr:hypothetical protein [Pseudomonas sp. FEN]